MLKKITCLLLLANSAHALVVKETSVQNFSLDTPNFWEKCNLNHQCYDIKVELTDYDWMNLNTLHTLFEDKNLSNANPSQEELKKMIQAFLNKLLNADPNYRETQVVRKMTFEGKAQNFVARHFARSGFADMAAHGYYDDTYTVFDLTNKRALSFEEILNAPEDKQKILDLLYKKRPKTEYTPEDDYPLDNFTFAKNQLIFIFPPYEIASYAEGTQIIKLKLDEIRPLLKPEIVASLESWQDLPSKTEIKGSVFE